MTFKKVPAPHFRTSDNGLLMNLDVWFCIAALCVFSAIYYGWRPVIVVLLSMVSAVVCETLCCLLMKRKPSVADGSALTTGALCGALMSPLSPYWVGMLAAAIAICCIKMPFGGTGRNMFNPAAGGVAVVTLLFPSLVFSYPTMNTVLPLEWDSLSLVITQKSLASQLAAGAVPYYSVNDLLLGRQTGAIGATAVLILLACAIYLFIRHSGSPIITLSYLATCVIGFVLFPRAENALLLELCAGYLLFAGIFLLCDPVTAPRFWLARIGYGVLGGTLVVLLRHTGQFEEGICFAILIANAFAPILDRNAWRVWNFFRKKREAKAEREVIADGK